MSDTVTLWRCRVCGVSRTNRRNWCDLGCGSDYNEMTPVEYVPAQERDKLAERLREAEAQEEIWQQNWVELSEGYDAQAGRLADAERVVEAVERYLNGSSFEDRLIDAVEDAHADYRAKHPTQEKGRR